jgi:phosphatidylserine/phosphatidylglycerophosphate/cardiolipin synthase-like enzyme
VNNDDAFIAWAPSEFIPGCRGFLLERDRQTETGEIIEPVENRVGFESDKPQPDEHRPSTEWPFQRFNWSDYAVNPGSQVRYRVTALVDEGAGRPYTPAATSDWTPWVELTPDVGDGFSCYFNRGLALSQFVARYMKEKGLTAAEFKSQIEQSVDPVFRAFLEGGLGARMREILKDAKDNNSDLYAALYELDDAQLEQAMLGVGSHLNLILSNGSDKAGDGNQDARTLLNTAGIATIDRLLGSKGLGHNKFVAISDTSGPRAVWTGSTNWSSTGLCTQINNGLLIEDAEIATLYRQQWDLLKQACPPTLQPAGFPPELVAANDQSHTFLVGATQVTVWFTRTSDGRDMQALRDVINGAQQAILFLMFTPGNNGLHILAGQRANEEGMYVRGVVSTLGTKPGDDDKNVLDVSLVSNGQTFKPDHYTVLQPQGIDAGFGEWISEVNRKTFLSQIGHAIVHSKVLVVDPFSENPIVVTGSHNFSTSASQNNDENLVIVRGHKQLAIAYATHIMSVYSHYRFRSYVRETLAKGMQPFSYLHDDDSWMEGELKSKQLEMDFWTSCPDPLP